MNHEITVIVLVLLFFLVGTIFSLNSAMQTQRSYLRSLDKKLDALLVKQGIDWPTLSPDVQALARDPGKKIAAIKLHREENPGIGLAEAKAEIEAFAERGLTTPAIKRIS